ncbi:hypothetical protein [Pseudoxanthomonas sp. UTMC 1351]|uniref:hypothetical protein n=1 Tax=Pseudoxanthomonas sp. UTMC 1351 TaxID=2695853 RepID=UPI0034CF8261
MRTPAVATFPPIRMKQSDALAQAIEFELIYYHRHRMALRNGRLMSLLRQELAAPQPRSSRINQLHEAMALNQKLKSDPKDTHLEVLVPLRLGVSWKSIEVAEHFMTDPANWR